MVTSKIERAKTQYYRTVFESVRSNTKKTCNVIDNILQSNEKRNKAVIKLVIFNDIINENNPDIVRIFNENFSTIGRRIDHFLQTNHTDRSLAKPFSAKLIFLQMIQYLIYEIIKTIMSLKNKSYHISTYAVKFIKHLSSIISPILTHLINKSISTGYIPKIFRTTRVVPIYKSGENTNVSNYRPISILPILITFLKKNCL